MTLFPKHGKAFEKQRACSTVSINIQIAPDLFSSPMFTLLVCLLLFSQRSDASIPGWEQPPTCSVGSNLLAPTPESVMNQRSRLLSSALQFLSSPQKEPIPSRVQLTMQSWDKCGCHVPLALGLPARGSAVSRCLQPHSSARQLEQPEVRLLRLVWKEKNICNKHTLQFTWIFFSTAETKTSLYVLGICLK